MNNNRLAKKLLWVAIIGFIIAVVAWLLKWTGIANQFLPQIPLPAFLFSKCPPDVLCTPVNNNDIYAQLIFIVSFIVAIFLLAISSVLFLVNYFRLKK